MKYTQALKFYSTPRAIAQVLGISDKAVYKWKKRGVVPIGRANRLQTASGGRLKVDPTVYARANGAKSDV